MVGGITFWIILLASVIAYWNVSRLRPLAIVVASLGFLLTLDCRAVLAIAAWGMAFYVLAPWTQGGTRRAQVVFYSLVGGLLGFLGWFKYAGPWLHEASETTEPVIRLIYGEHQTDGFLIPLGISYFTFKLIHYLIESSRGNIGERSFAHFVSYLVFFPIFVAGPIERYENFLSNRETEWSYQTTLSAIRRIQLGIIKKFFIGDIVLNHLIASPTTDAILLNLSDVPVVTVWLHLTYYFLIAYMDFSGYSDIAIGSARLFGIRVTENFNFPLRAQNIGDFWKRWHMSLSNWCQAYVYMPTIGLTRNPYVAVFATMSAIALWHAGTWTWICWGLYHALGVTAFLTWGRFKRKHKISLAKYQYYPVLAQMMTLMFVIGSFSFMAGYKQGELYPAFRILVKLVGVTLPA